MDAINIPKKEVTTATVEKSLLDYINEFDMTPPEYGYCGLAVYDPNLSNISAGTNLSNLQINPACLNAANYVIKLYNSADEVTDTIEQYSSAISTIDINVKFTIENSYGKFLKFTVEPKTSANPITSPNYSSARFNSVVKLVFGAKAFDAVTTQVQNTFNVLNNIRIYDISAIGASNTIIDLSGFLQLSLIKEFTFPATMAGITELDYGLKGNLLLKSITFQAALDSLTKLNNFAEGDTLLEEVTLPTSMNALTTLASAWSSCYKLQEIEYPATLNLVATMMAAHSNNHKITSITLPTSMTAITSLISFIDGCYKLTTLTECLDWGTNQIDCQGNNSLYSLTTFKQSAMKCSKIGLKGVDGQVNALTSIDIDYANSLFTGTSPQIDFSYCSLDATEINRILTALPTVTGKTAVFTGNPGAATCDTSIATAKGWTVTVA